MRDPTREQHPDLEAAAAGAPASLPRWSLTVSQPSRGSYASPAFRIERVPESSMGPRLPRGSAVSGQQLSLTRGGRTLGTVPGTRTRCRLLETCLTLGIPSKPPFQRSRAASSPAPRRGGDESRAPARPSCPQQDVGSGERAARPAGAGRRAGAKPRVCRLGREGSQGLQARLLTRGLWGSPWTRARPAPIHT